MPEDRAQLIENVRSTRWVDGYTRLRCPCGGEVFVSKASSCDGEGECDKCGQLYSTLGQRLCKRARDVDPADAGERYDDDY